MYNQKDILARLQAGESADVIAQEMVDALNAANAEYAAAQEAANQKQAKAEYVEEFAALIKDYIMDFHGDSYIAEMIKDQEIDPAEIVEMLDQSFEQLDAEIRKMKEMEKMLHNILGKIQPAEECNCGCPEHSHGKIEVNPDAIGAFLKANGLA